MDYHSITQALDALRAGQCILVTDDPDRENHVRRAGRSRHDDVPDLHGLCHEPSTIGKQEKRKLL